MENPPEDTRAWGRTMLLRLARSEEVEDVNWDEVRLSLPGRRWSGRRLTVPLADPLGFTRAAVEEVFREGRELKEVAESLAGLEAGSRGGFTH